jgi:predicted transposase/invertase (TIGR01784 family)
MPSKRSKPDRTEEDAKVLREVLSLSKGNHYAISTTDTAFKHLLSLSTGAPKELVLSFLNSFIPCSSKEDEIVDVTEAPIALPALRIQGEKQTFMDLHVVTQKGEHCIIEMQARRHVQFDERAVFYAASTFSRQLSDKELSEKDWYLKLKRVIALQILDYDTNRVKGIDTAVADLLIGRVKEHPMKRNQYTKHYLLTDAESGQIIDCLQLIQVELPRAKNALAISPEEIEVENATPAQWWLSLLKYSDRYTDEIVSRLKGIPNFVKNALDRLDLNKWNPSIVKEYKENLTDRDTWGTVLEVERAEGRKEGIKEGIEGIVKHMITTSRMSPSDVARLLGLPVEEVNKIAKSLSICEEDEFS